MLTTTDKVILGVSSTIIWLWVMGWFVHLSALFVSLRKMHKRKPYLNDIKLPGVSIIKPLLGFDEELEENLESFFLIEYPKVFNYFFFVVELDLTFSFFSSNFCSASTKKPIPLPKLCFI